MIGGYAGYKSGLTLAHFNPALVCGTAQLKMFIRLKLVYFITVCFCSANGMAKRFLSSNDWLYLLTIPRLKVLCMTMCIR